MKKLVAIMMALVLCSVSFLALADGEVTVSQKQFYTVVGDYSQYGYLFAKIENTGDAPVTLDYGKVVTFDDQDNILDTSDYISAYPRYLEPGEYAYLYNISFDSVGDPIVADYKFNIGKSDRTWTVVRLDAEGAYDAGDPSKATDDYMLATFTNTTEEPLAELSIVYVLLDEEGTILYIATDKLYNVALHPGSTLTTAESINSEVVKYIAAQGVTPASVDVLVFVQDQVW